MKIIELLKVVLIGIIEGITEWVPISSTGHMLLFDKFIPLNMNEEFKEVFFVVIQLGAILAVVTMMWKKMFPFEIKNGIKIKKDIFNVWLKVAMACVPTAGLGFFLDDFLEEYFGGAGSIAVMLILYGILFIIVEYWNGKSAGKVVSVNDIDYKTAFMIGLFQVIAMIPGTSRSGATIIGALILGVSRLAATEFTFFLAVPTMLGASFLKLVKFGFAFTGEEIVILLLGMAVAFAVSVFTISFLMNYIRRHDFKVFGWYRIILGIIILLIVL